jgi:hypothetical protein
MYRSTLTAALLGFGSGLVIALPSAAQPGPSAVLFDFEDGIEGWWGNPWGGGECEVAPATDAKFGSGALTCIYRNVERGANAVSPFFAEDAAWRQQPWGGISLWLRGDGSPAKVRISLETSQEGSTGFSVNPPLEDTSWHRLYIPFRTFWSREKLRVDPSRLRRVIIGCSGTHEFQLDQIALEAPGRPVLTNSLPSIRPGPINDALPAPILMALDDGRFEARLDLSAARDRGDLAARGSMAVPGGEGSRREVRLAPEDVTAREVSLVLSPTVVRDATAELTVEVATADGASLAAWGYSFPVLTPAIEPAPPPIAIYPVPKDLKKLEGQLRFRDRVRVAAIGLADEDLERTVGMFAREMQDYYGRDTVTGGDARQADVVAAVLRSAEPLPEGFLPEAMAGRTDELGEEGYLLRVTRDRAVVAALSPPGVYYGLSSLLAAIDDGTVVPAEAAAPCCEIVDYPSLAFRGVSISNPTARWGHPNDAWIDVAFLNDYVFRTMARQKLNKLVFIIGEGMQFDSHPELRAPQAWSKDEFRGLIDFAEDNYIEVIPLVTVLGHANWFAIRHPELKEPGHDPNIACVRLPETNQLIADVFDEVIELFQPKTFHIGMDECWWKTLGLPEEERCPRCTGHWADIVAEQATFFRNYLAERGIRAMMWGDMLLPEHNGGAPYHTAQALGRIPKDMIIANWSWSLAPESSKRFRDAGLEVVQANSRGLSRDQRPYLVGNLQGIWSKTSWLTDTYYKGSVNYSYLSLPQSAEFSWNIDPRPSAERGFDWSMLDERADSLLRRMSLKPSPLSSGDQTPIDLSSAFNISTHGADPPSPERWFGTPPGRDLSQLPRGDVTIGRTRFQLPEPAEEGALDAVALTEEDQEVSIGIGQPAAEVRLLVTCHVPEDQREAFTTQFHKKEAIQGVRTGTATFELADGSTDELPLLYAYNVLPWDRQEAPPYLLGSLGALTCPLAGQPAEGGAIPSARVFVVQWVNPKVGDNVEGVTFRKTGTEASVVVVAVTAE